MKKAVCAVLIALGACATMSAGTPDTGFEYPMVPARLLADSLAEKCAICVKKLRDNAYVHLDGAFPPGRALRGGNFVKEPGGAYLFAADGHQEKVFYKKDAEKGDIHLPRVVFRFHTAADHLVGIGTTDYSGEEAARAFKTIPVRGKFRGNATVIRFSYGNGQAFSYSPAENIIFVHCRLDTVERTPDHK